jgi:hypothetical protein
MSASAAGLLVCRRFVQDVRLMKQLDAAMAQLMQCVPELGAVCRSDTEHFLVRLKG